MNRVTINLDALRHNLGVIGDLMKKQGATWSVVTKTLCGHLDTLRSLYFLGARSVADSRLDNLRAADRAASELEKWYLRLPHLSVVKDIIQLADVSLNSEMEIIRILSEEAARQNKKHNIVIMVELGDLTEGILPGSLVKFYQNVFELPNIEVIGLGAQIGCAAGAVPNVDQVSQLLLYRELLEIKFERHLPIISAGTSRFLPLVMENKIPRGVNHFRIGETLFLGTDLIHNCTMQCMRDDVCCLEAEICEIKEKSLAPTREVGVLQPVKITPVSALPAYSNSSPGRRGYRALVSVGYLDTDVSGLIPMNSKYQIAGANDDITIVNLGDTSDGLKVGDTLKFKVNRSAFVRLMHDPYIPKAVMPNLEEFRQTLPETWKTVIPPTVHVHECRAE